MASLEDKPQKDVVISSKNSRTVITKINISSQLSFLENEYRSQDRDGFGLNMC